MTNAEYLDQVADGFIIITRCKDCVIHDICRYRLGLGENGFCSQGRRKETEDDKSRMDK